MLYLDILGSQLLGYLDDNLTLRGLPAAPRTVLVVQIGIVAWLFDTIKSRIRKGRHAEDASLWTRKLYQLHDMLAHFLKFLGMRIDMELYPYPGYNSIREFLGSEPQNRISKILYLLTVISN
jgi:hypothetical protein